MGAVHRHNFEIVRKGYSPEAVDQVILELTIARNDSEALVTKLQQQLEQGNAAASDPEDPQRIVAQAKDEARRIVESAHRQADAMVAGAVARDISHNGTSDASPEDIARLLQIAEIFESELTKIARDALGGVGALTKQLERQKAKAPSPAPASPSSNGAVESPEGGGTAERLRRIAAESRKEAAPPAETHSPAPAPTAPPVMPTRSATPRPAAQPEESTSLAARIARQAEADARESATREAPAASTSREIGEERVAERPVAQEESTSLAARIARQAEADARDSADGDAPSPDSASHEITDNRAAEWAAVREEATSLAARVARSTAGDDENTQDDDRGSYYSRRSAHLPRIGEQAAAGALASVRSVRKSGGEGATDDDHDDDEERAAQTA
jgi:hypothetical protein